MYIAQHDRASTNTRLHGQIWGDTKVSTHTGVTMVGTASGTGRGSTEENWMMMVGWTRGCKCKDFPVWTPERRQRLHGHGFRQENDALPAPWGQAEPSQLSTEVKIQKYVPSLSSLIVWFSPGRELLGCFTVYLFRLSFVVCFAGILWLLVVLRHTETTPSPEGDVNQLIWLICWFWKNFNSFDQWRRIGNHTVAEVISCGYNTY